MATNFSDFLRFMYGEITYVSNPPPNIFWQQGNTHRRTPLIFDGQQIKYLRVPDEIIDLVKDQQSQPSGSGRGRGGAPRGEHGGRGRGERGRGGGGRARGRGRG